MSDSWAEQKKRWASMRAAFADHVYEASEPNLPAPVLAETPQVSRVATPDPVKDGGEARESTENCDRTGKGSSMADSRGGQTFTDEQAIALLQMGFNDLSGGNTSNQGERPVAGEHRAVPPSLSSIPPSEERKRNDPSAQIITSPNGIFAGTVIGIKASATNDGITHVAFGPDAKTAANRLREKLK